MNSNELLEILCGAVRHAAMIRHVQEERAGQIRKEIEHLPAQAREMACIAPEISPTQRAQLLHIAEQLEEQFSTEIAGLGAGDSSSASIDPWTGDDLELFLAQLDGYALQAQEVALYLPEREAARMLRLASRLLVATAQILEVIAIEDGEALPIV